MNISRQTFNLDHGENRVFRVEAVNLAAGSDYPSGRLAQHLTNHVDLTETLQSVSRGDLG